MGPCQERSEISRVREQTPRESQEDAYSRPPAARLIRNNRTAAQESGAIESWRGLSEENNSLLPTAFLEVVEGPPGLSAVV
jgi:hypothetical protein